MLAGTLLAAQRPPIVQLVPAAGHAESAQRVGTPRQELRRARLAALARSTLMLAAPQPLLAKAVLRACGALEGLEL